LWNAKVHYRIQNRPPRVPILSQINLVHALHHASREPILILSSHLRQCLLSGLFPSGLPHQNPVCTCPATPPRYVFYSTPLLPRLSWAQISSQLHFLKRPQPTVPPPCERPRFLLPYTHTKWRCDSDSFTKHRVTLLFGQTVLTFRHLS